MNEEDEELPCTEPDGNQIITTNTMGTYAHILMVKETGQCPWCGGTEY